MEVLTPAKRHSFKKQLPGWVQPCLPLTVKVPFSDPDWLFERAYTGIRCIIYKQAHNVRIFSVQQEELTSSFPEIVQVLASQKGNYIVDGVITAIDDEVNSLPLLPQPVRTQNQVDDMPVFLYLFDMMHGGDYDLTDVKLLTRKDLLQTLIDFEGPLRFCDHQLELGEKYYEEAMRKGWDGIVAKKMNSIYEGGSTENWVQLSC